MMVGVDVIDRTDRTIITFCSIFTVLCSGSTHKYLRINVTRILTFARHHCRNLHGV